MKKLTAGIFTVLMGLVTVNAAEAAVASKGYVDEKVGVATADITALEATVAANKTAAEKLVNDYKAENDAKVSANTAAIAKNAEDIAANTGLISGNTDAIAANTAAIAGEKTAREQADNALDDRLDTAEGNITTLQGEVAAMTGGENSVAAQIAGALTEAKDYTDDLAEGAVATNTAAISAINNETTGILAQAKGYADGLADNYDAAGSAAQALADAKADAAKYIDATELEESQTAQNTTITNAYTAADKVITDSIGEVAAGKTVVGMIADAQTAATYDDAEVRGLIADNASDISDNATAIATKLTDTTTISADGKYVLTAVTVGDDTTYAWELIERATDTTLE